MDKQTLGFWERKNGVTLPTDLKEYYQSTNGFKLTWSLEHAGDILPIGELSINTLNQLVEIHIAAKQTNSSGQSAGGSTARSGTSSLFSGRPKTCSADSTPRHNTSGPSSGSSRKLENPLEFGAGSHPAPFTELEQTLFGSGGQAKQALSGLIYGPDNKAFILDSGRCGWGKVCLVYCTPPSSIIPTTSANSQLARDTKSSGTTSSENRKLVASGAATTEPYVEIWFMDPSFQWHYLAPTFTHFYRMLLFHLGLPQWQYRFTPFGLSSWAEQMFWLVAPHLLQAPKLSRFPSMYHGEGLWCTDVPSDAATPNPSVNVITTQLFRRKKKDREKQSQ